ncbi:AGC/PKA protein kinase [Trichophyton rubrum D6]|uniref:cAMP-dependent protein kinase n=2 Tax=Trichophyton rubrum TaxID=5551 RepID=F2SZ98_TRIRC|nr:AGC/PKA protein kinase [Trichophyton rubrum CBS 118892]EZF46259.1 AGC/PKA protein kinase [Trichophyton rubrum CBS 100081]EZF56918.1 AGC/PKA protein kinase [Trichophyton rubrum CBS 288.86]EZF67462.1 AGC/PKA protein kinase [Trichophyton rubrum CBS 289.86]EZF88782.1 AGC/PKA protein kinase [Trichophyton rubrum MR1448]EZF99653.1 AGC/PKA protein kinase [Trichophyton rubrum MR1459]EZG21128.1 AGC/PKA protein kinase [Trichophyton rubrum CBS 202.88]KDB38001.1 AGC/PKA protein kinase [Trichophyton ru
MATTKMIKQLLPDIAHAKEQQHQQQQVLEQDHIEAEVKPDRLSWPASRPRTPKDVVQARLKQDAGLPDNGLAIDDFDLIKTLGTGTFARVWFARLKAVKEPNRDIFALKILRKAEVIKLKQVEHVRNESKCLSKAAGHPFITTLITTFSDEQCLYMLLEYCPGGEIFSFLRRARRFDEYTSKFYAAEITLVIGYLHDMHGIAYRDLKPENILLDQEGHLKLVDFGFAKQLYNLETYTLCGTPEYLAPEVIHNSGHGLAVDWWALGILIYEFIVGQPPFWDSNPMGIYEKIVAGCIRFPANMPASAKDIISALCKVNPSERPGHISGGSQRVRDHPFFEGIDWDDLYNKRAKGPIVPRVSHPADTANFEEYPDPPGPATQAVYTDEMKARYEEIFQDF